MGDNDLIIDFYPLPNGALSVVLALYIFCSITAYTVSLAQGTYCVKVDVENNYAFKHNKGIAVGD